MGPTETLTKRLYSAAAIGWALALYGLSLLSPAAVRALVSPWHVVGVASASRWVTLKRWCAAAGAGRLFQSVRGMGADWPARRVAGKAGATLAAYALPSLEPPSLAVQAFHGAARAH